MKVTLESPEATLSLGAHLAETWVPGVVLLFDGDLGAGKTTCVQGLAQALGIVGIVTSPTFTLIEQYTGGHWPLFHIDLYRLTPAEVPPLGLEEIWDEMAIVAIEWAERLLFLPEDYLRIALAWQEPRTATLSAHGKSAVQMLTALEQAYRPI